MSRPWSITLNTEPITVEGRVVRLSKNYFPCHVWLVACNQFTVDGICQNSTFIYHLCHRLVTQNNLMLYREAITHNLMYSEHTIATKTVKTRLRVRSATVSVKQRLLVSLLLLVLVPSITISVSPADVYNQISTNTASTF